MKTIDVLLAEAPDLAHLDPEHLATIAGCGHNQVFAPGERLMRAGEPATAFFVVRRGTVSLETYVPRRGAVMIETLHEGDLVGWSWLVSPHRVAFDCRAVGEVHALAFDGACLRGKCDADAALGYALYGVFSSVMAERLQATRLRLLDLHAKVPGEPVPRA